MAAHMLGHILLMNFLAPAGIVLWRLLSPHPILVSLSTRISAATAFQIIALWGWHLPPAIDLTARSPVASAAMSLSLLGAALWFWACIFDAAANARWRALGSLLVTGKLFCLLGVLLTFAPRPVFGAHTHGVDALADQQLGGLLMLIACPLIYVTAAVIVAARWLVELDNTPRLTIDGGTP